MSGIKFLPKWLIRVVAGLLLFVIGTWGYLDYFKQKSQPYTYIDLLTCAVDLFQFKFHFALGPKPWQLSLVQVLAPLFTLYMIGVGGTMLMRDKIRLRRINGHAIVSGLSDEVMSLVKRLHGMGKSIVVIEDDPDSPFLAECTELKTINIIGPPASPEILKKAAVEKAAMVFACSKDDVANFEMAMSAFTVIKHNAPRGEKIFFYLHLLNTKWTSAFPGFIELTNTIDRFEPIVFNSHENIARAALNRHPIDRVKIDQNSPLHVHILLIGFDRLARELLLQIAYTGHFGNLRKTVITVIGDGVAKERDVFLNRYPFIGEVLELTFMDYHPASGQAVSFFEKVAATETELVSIFITGDNPSWSVSTALDFPLSVVKANIPVYILLRDPADEDASFAGIVQKKSNLVSFGHLDDAMNIDLEMDTLAQALHEDYVEHAISQGKIMGSTATLQPWDRLEYHFKQSNRRQADHFSIKLRAVGCITVAIKDSPEAIQFRFTDEEIEVMARMEHARWIAEKVLEGWRLGPSDKANRISPYLIPYDELSEEIKEYDRQPIRKMVELLRDKMGKGIKRIEDGYSAEMGGKDDGI